MKKSLLLLAAAIICGMFFTACEKDEGPVDDGPIEYDKSLAWSVTFSQPISEAEGSYDAIPLEDLEIPGSYLSTNKVSDTEISVYCTAKWGETVVNISIPLVPLSGKRYSATFDYSCTNATVKYGETEYTSVSASVKGWIKDFNFGDTRYSPYMPVCVYDIKIECTIDGKILSHTFTEDMKW